MKLLTLNTLNGIGPSIQQDIFQAMRSCTNGQRLAVCLYFMSDLPESEHHLSNIEKNLRLMFPASLRDGYLPDDYADFQASLIRYYFNAENRSERNGQISSNERLWENIRRGFWKNTDIGNQYALQVLQRRGITIQHRETIIVPEDKKLATSSPRTYLQEDLAKQAEEALIEELPEIKEGDFKTVSIEVTIYRRLRDTALARTLKALHQNRCQICGNTISISDNHTYAEAHHIKPLGHPHNGPDISENILILCPNHHVMCDYGAIELDGSKLLSHPSHSVGDEYLEYHNSEIVT